MHNSTNHYLGEYNNLTRLAKSEKIIHLFYFTLFITITLGFQKLHTIAIIMVKIVVGLGGSVPPFLLSPRKRKRWWGLHTTNFSLAIRILKKQYTENKASTLIMQARFWSSNHNAILLSLKSAMDTPCLIIVLNS